ncbi:MAG TPA: hypothetical protein VMI94_09280 [Bryobacteraceae bacterium]|nr:hypothetical protein [Bryobacteraceae bacterium]
MSSTVETCINDPMLFMAPLAHSARFYPMGFPADVASNSPEVLAAARENWGVYQARFDRPPISVHAIVSGGGAGLPPDPVLRGQRHLLLWMCDRENFSVCDWRRRFGFCFVTETTVADHVFFNWHFLDAIVLTLQELNFYTALHAACVAWQGSGVLLYGESGAGKSTLSYACARRGWTFVADDASTVVWDAGRVVAGTPHHFRFRAEAPELFPELRGRTTGYQLGHKPTIQVPTADLPIHTAPDCHLDRIVFIRRDGSSRASLRPVPASETVERIRADMPVFDPELEERRQRTVAEIAQLPAFELRYAHYADAVDRLEELVRGGEPAC